MMILTANTNGTLTEKTREVIEGICGANTQKITNDLELSANCDRYEGENGGVFIKWNYQDGKTTGIIRQKY